jgi:hypothetical protein
MIEIVRIFITAGDGENARGSAMTAASLPANPHRRSACPSNTTPASDVMRPPSKAAEKAILCHGGCGFDTIV